jgi:hypothetical protein
MPILTYRILVGIFFKNNIMETLVEIITELRQEITVLQNLVDLKKEEIEKEKASSLFWFKKFNEPDTTVNPAENE